MKTSGWIFMGIYWSLLIGLVVFCLLLPLGLSANERVYGSLVRAAEDLDRGRYVEAEKGLESVNASPVWKFWKSVLLARTRLNQEEPQEALELLEDLPPPPKDLLNKNQGFYRRLYRQALETGLQASTRLSKPRETWEIRLWAYFPDLEGAAAEAVPDGVRTEDKVARLHLLFERSLFEKIPGLVAPDEISEADLPAEDKCRAWFEWGFAHQKLKRKEEALKGYERVERSSCRGTIPARALYWKGSLEAELKQYDAAEATFKKLAKRSADGRYKDDAYYRLHRIYQARNESEKAERALKDLLDLPQGDMKEKYLWEEGFAAYRRGDYGKALGLFDRIAGMRPSGTEAQPQALYWKGQTEEILSGKKPGGSSAAAYRKILEAYPFSFYALLAEIRLGRPAPLPKIAKSKPRLPSDKGLAEGLKLADRLNRRKEHTAAADLLDYLTHLHPQAVKERPEAFVQRWIAAGDFHRALESAAERLDTSVFDIDLRKDHPLTRALYPVAYPEEVRRAAEKNRLPVGLIVAVMREESLFLPEARSRAGAVGVMQLMPATARMKARRLGLPYSYEDLRVPAANIALGSSYLREMTDRFGGRTSLAVMAYNAGPGNVARWLRSQGDLPLDEFIESAPLSETRAYVKRVLRSARIYQHLMGRAKRTDFFASLDPPRSYADSD